VQKGLKGGVRYKFFVVKHQDAKNVKEKGVKCIK